MSHPEEIILNAFRPKENPQMSHHHHHGHEHHPDTVYEPPTIEQMSEAYEKVSVALVSASKLSHMFLTELKRLHADSARDKNTIEILNAEIDRLREIPRQAAEDIRKNIRATMQGEPQTAKTEKVLEDLSNLKAAATSAATRSMELALNGNNSILQSYLSARVMPTGRGSLRPNTQYVNRTGQERAVRMLDANVKYKFQQDLLASVYKKSDGNSDIIFYTNEDGNLSVVFMLREAGMIIHYSNVADIHSPVRFFDSQGNSAGPAMAALVEFEDLLRCANGLSMLDPNTVPGFVRSPVTAENAIPEQGPVDALPFDL